MLQKLEDKIVGKEAKWEEPDETLDDYVKRMGRNGVYIDHYMLQIAAEAFGGDIIIVPMFDESAYRKLGYNVIDSGKNDKNFSYHFGLSRRIQIWNELALPKHRAD